LIHCILVEEQSESIKDDLEREHVTGSQISHQTLVGKMQRVLHKFIKFGKRRRPLLNGLPHRFERIYLDTTWGLPA